MIGTSGTRIVHLRARGRLRPLPAGMGMVLPEPAVAVRDHRHPLPRGQAARRRSTSCCPGGWSPARTSSIGAFLRARLGDGIVRRFADPMIGGIYGAGVDELSLDAVLPSLRADEAAHRSLMLAAIAQGRKAQRARPGRRTRTGLTVPHVPPAAWAAWSTPLVDQLAAAGADLRLGTRVTDLRPIRRTAPRPCSPTAAPRPVDAVILAGGVTSSAALLAGAGAASRRRPLPRCRWPPPPW